MKHFTRGLIFGGTSAAVASASQASVMWTVVIGATVTAAVWALSYAIDHH